MNRDQFFSICADALDLEVDLLSETSKAEEFATWDSLSHWDMISALEDSYQIEFTLDEVSDFTCLGDIMTALRSKGVSLE